MKQDFLLPEDWANFFSLFVNKYHTLRSVPFRIRNSNELRSCKHWRLKDNYRPSPFEKAPIQNCGNCRCYEPDKNCVYPFGNN